jgi:hypothetical protein
MSVVTSDYKFENCDCKVCEFSEGSFSFRVRVCAPKEIARFSLSDAVILGRDSSVGITTRYRLDCPGIESRWGREFPHPPRLPLRSIQPTIQWASAVLSRG